MSDAHATSTSPTTGAAVVEGTYVFRFRRVTKTQVNDFQI